MKLKGLGHGIVTEPRTLELVVVMMGQGGNAALAREALAFVRSFQAD